MNTSEISPSVDTSSVESHQMQERFILAQVGSLVFVFASHVVEEISILQRSQILSLPFYDTSILGVIHHRGSIVPLISLRHAIGVPANLTRESVTVLRLSPTTGNLAGLGLVVDTTLGSKPREELPPNIFGTATLPDLTHGDPRMCLFSCELLGDRLWHPQRWEANPPSLSHSLEPSSLS